MMGSTHALVGTSLALLVTQPSSIVGCVCAVAGGAIGGLIPDLDLSKSDEMEERVSSKWKAALGIIIVIAGAAIIDSIFDLGIAERLVTQNALLRILCILAFFALIVMGAISSHRSFMHSIVAAISLSLLLYFVIPNLPSLSVSFVVGYFSHIFLDLFNKRGIQIFWPAKRKCSFGLCSADGKANSIINAIALVAAVFLTAWFVVPIIEPYGAGFITSTDIFVIYLIVINILAYVVLTIDWYVGSKLPGDEESRHTWINLIAMAGGVLGQLFALVQRTRPCKDNATWYMLTISELLLWIVICLIAFGVIHPNHVVIDLENFLSLKWFLIYLLIINVLTFIIYLLDKKKHTKLDLSELACLLLAILGGSIGALFAISITGRKRGSAHFRIGIPVVLISQSIIMMLLLISA